MKKLPLVLAAVLWVSCSVAGAATTSSMSQLIEAGQNVSCDFKKSDANGSQSGTIYVSQDKMRGDFNVSNPSGTSVMHMVHDSGYSYTWGGPFGENQGMKMKVDGNSPGAANRQGPNLEEEMEFDCRPWSVDQSLFEVPANIQFMELGGLSQAMGQGSGAPDMKQLQCMACDEVPEGPERQQCQTTLGCA